MSELFSIKNLPDFPDFLLIEEFDPEISRCFCNGSVVDEAVLFSKFI